MPDTERVVGGPGSLRPACLLLILLLAPGVARAAEVIEAGAWELHSSFWMSLHQTLIAEAMRPAARGLAGLAPAEQAAWTGAVDAYRAAGGRGDLTFAKPMGITTDALSQVADDAGEPLIDAPLREALLRAAPLYRRHGWEADDRAARFFIAGAAALLRQGGDDLAKRHAAIYRTPWPERIRVYITPSAGPFGAYTMTGLAGGVITTMSRRDEGYQGFRSLEMLLHEGSHAVVGAREGTVAAAIAAAAKARGVGAPGDLWHAILFATSGELTRRYLADRGVTGFTPSSADLFTRVWPAWREPIERYWYPYLDGNGTLEEAIDQVVGAIGRAGR